MNSKKRTPEEQAAYRKEYVRAYAKQYKKTHAEKVNAYNREWRAKRNAEFKRLKELEKSLNPSVTTEPTETDEWDGLL